MPGIPDKPAACELCGRAMEGLTRHHLIPRTRHRNKRNRREFSREEVRTRILWVCRPCHSHIHRVLSEKDMEREYNTREALIGHPEIRRFTAWIGRRPPGFHPTSGRNR